MVLLIPAIIAWLLACRWPSRGLAIFIGIYAFFGVFFFTARYIHPRLDFPLAVVEKQQAFLKLQGNSTVPITELEPGVVSFIRNTPQAIALAILRPYPNDVNHLLSLAASLEINFLLLFFVAFLFWRKKNDTSSNAIYLCLFAGFSMLLAIGFSVNNLGAIVRYRSIAIPLLVALMAAQMDWNRILQVYNKIIKKHNVLNS